MNTDAAGDAPVRDGETEDMLPEREVRFATSVHRVHRRPMGLDPAVLLACLAAVTFVVALVMFATGSWAPGLVLLAASASEVCLFFVAVRREPESQPARATRHATRQSDGLLRMSSVIVRTSTPTGVELARLWHRRALLRVRFRRRLGPLGEAVYRGDRLRAAELEAQARELDHELSEADRRAARLIASRREEIERERVTSQRTQKLKFSDSDGLRPPTS